MISYEKTIELVNKVLDEREVKSGFSTTIKKAFANALKDEFKNYYDNYLDEMAKDILKDHKND